MNASAYRTPLIWGLALAVLTWLILSLAPRQPVSQAKESAGVRSTQKDTSVQVFGESLRRQTDVTFSQTNTTALANRVPIDTSHVYGRPLDSMSSPPTPVGQRTTRYTRLRVFRRRPYITDDVRLRPRRRLDSLNPAVASSDDGEDTKTDSLSHSDPAPVASVDSTTSTATSAPSVPANSPARKQYVHSGQLAFDWPSRMQLNVTYPIHLVISWDTTRNYLIAQVDSLVSAGADTAGQRRKEEIKSIGISRRMRAVLTGASPNDTSITIMPIGDPERTIDFADYKTASWSWDVTPHRSGRISLTVYFERLTSPQPIYIYSKSIDVEGVEISAWAKLLTFLTNLDKLLAIIVNGTIGTLIGLVYKNWQERRKNNKLPDKQ